jgi:hypothetical protein
VGEVLVGVTCRPRERSGTTPWQERVGERDVVGSACGLGLRLPRGLRATSFGLMLVHKPAYEFRWGETCRITLLLRSETHRRVATGNTVEPGTT